MGCEFDCLKRQGLGVLSVPIQTLQNQKRTFESTLLRMLPHRYPFLLVDRVTKFTPGIEIQGVKTFSANEAMLVGYSPSSPVVPTGILLEAVTQLGAILVLERPQMAGKVAMILQIPSARLFKPVAPGDSVRFEARVLKLRDTLGELRGSAFLDETLIAEGQMRFAIADRNAIFT